MTASIPSVDGGVTAAKRAAIYCRIATQPQENPSAAVNEQINACAAYCTAHGYTVVDHYIDAGYSGNAADRPALQRLLRDVEAGRVDVVVVSDLDRIARSPRLLSEILHGLQSSGIGLVSVTQSLDTRTPAGQTMLDVLRMFAQEERR